MDITPLIPQGRQIIDGYGAGGFKIAGVQLAGSVFVFPDHTDAWPVADFASLTPEHFAAVIKQEIKPEFVLLGCGAQMQPAPMAIKNFLRLHNIALDCMDTGAACRTYNVLVTEERRVCAALIAV